MDINVFAKSDEIPSLSVQKGNDRSSESNVL